MHGFTGYLRGLLGACVQLERGGPEACQGRLASVQEDYLTLRASVGGDLHLPLHHIRSVTPLAPPDGTQAPAAHALPPTFAELLASHRDRCVRLNHAGPELSTGVLRSCDEDHLLVEVSPDETACFTLFHVRSLYVPPEETAPDPDTTAEPLQGR